MSELHILDAGTRGTAQCFFWILPQGRQTVVVDGGGKYYGARRPLLEFLTQRKYLRYRLAHPDPSAPRSLRRLCAPGRPGAGAAGCGALQRSSVCRPGVSGIWRSGVFTGEYHTFFPISEPQRGQKLIRSKECAGRTFTFGDFALDCLYPMRGQYAAVGDLCGGPVCA